MSVDSVEGRKPSDMPRKIVQDLKKRQDQEVKFKICDCYGPVTGRKRNNTNVYLFSISHQLYLRHATFMYKNV